MKPATDESKPDVVKAALLHEALLSKLRVIRERRGGTIADVVTQVAGSAVDREYRKVLGEMQAEIEAGK